MRHITRSYILLNIGMERDRREISIEELRAVQKRVVRNEMTDDDKLIFDAMLSAVCTKNVYFSEPK